jgi:methionyl-tRNA formyltransferase
MRIIFAGTSEFARSALQALHKAGFSVALVLTQPDRPAGRGLKLQASPVKQFAQEQGLEVAQPRSLRLEGKYPDDACAAQSAILATQADACVVAAYGLILPQWVLDAPRLGAFNIHASLLPRWRGAAPIHRAVQAGDTQTGITIMQMDAGLDTGDMLLTQTLPIADTDTTGSLHDALADMGGRLMVQALQLAQRGALQPARQLETGISYAHKIEKAEAALDWSQDAATLARQVRAFNPFPGAFTTLRGETIKVWRCEIDSCLSNESVLKGTIFYVNDRGISVICGNGSPRNSLRITELQRAGGKRLSVADFVRGFDLQPGMVFGS